MEVLLLKNQKEGKIGDIVTVSQMRAKFLIDVKAAAPVELRVVEVPEKKTARRTTRTKS